MKILALNVGSSSLKALVCEVGSGDLPSRRPPGVWEAKVELEGEDIVENTLKGAARAMGAIDLVAHRIVHGGRAFRETTLLTPEVKAHIARLSQFAPAHNRLELEAVDAVERVFGADFPQVAVFDTAFHKTLPLVASIYPGPLEWFDQGIRRYGFHGISHQYVSRRAGEILGRSLESLRLISCHLGNGCSLAAVEGGRSIDTTMGFTPLDGLMMGTRSGSVDPGIIIHLIRNCGYSAEQVDRMLNEESGLKGISGISGDMRKIRAGIENNNPRAQLAFDVYVHRLAQGIGAMLASLGGAEGLVFTGGVGENSPPLREAVCQRLRFLQLSIDRQKNNGSPADEDIADARSAVRVLVIRSDEDWELVREAHRLMSLARRQPES